MVFVRSEPARMLSVRPKARDLGEEPLRFGGRLAQLLAQHDAVAGLLPVRLAQRELQRRTHLFRDLLEELCARVLGKGLARVFAQRVHRGGTRHEPHLLVRLHGVRDRLGSAPEPRQHSVSCRGRRRRCRRLEGPSSCSCT